MTAVLDNLNGEIQKVAPGAPLFDSQELADADELPFECVFAPLEEFAWWHMGKLIGLYHVGNTYNATKGARHAVLRKKVAQWASEGKVKIYPLGPGVHFLTIGG